MSRNTQAAFRLMNRIADGNVGKPEEIAATWETLSDRPPPLWDADYEAAKEELRRREIAAWRRNYRKIAVFKALRGVGLIILICGGTLGVLYALNS